METRALKTTEDKPGEGKTEEVKPEVDEPKENLEVGAVDKASEHDATENDQKTSTEATLQTEEKSDDMNYTYINRYMRHIICRFFDIK